MITFYSLIPIETKGAVGILKLFSYRKRITNVPTSKYSKLHFLKIYIYIYLEIHGFGVLIQAKLLFYNP